MSTRKERGVKKAPVAPVGNKKKSSLDSGNQSIIGCASFIEGLQQTNGNPLHSTAIEEDLNPSKETQMAKSQVGKNITQKVKTIVNTRPSKNEQAKVEKKSGSASSRSSDAQEEADTDARSKKRRNQVLYSDDDTDEDTSWKPSPKKATIRSLERTSKKLSTGIIGTDARPSAFDSLGFAVFASISDPRQLTLEERCKIAPCQDVFRSLTAVQR